MQFVVLATDTPDHLTLRQANRAAHRAYLRQDAGRDVNVLLAGPTLAASGDMNGTLLIVEADGRAAVERFVAGDPYAQAGLFADVEIRPLRVGLGRIDPSAPDPMADRPQSVA